MGDMFCTTQEPDETETITMTPKNYFFPANADTQGAQTSKLRDSLSPDFTSFGVLWFNPGCKEGKTV